MTKNEALKLALDFLMTRRMGAELVIDALQEALAQPSDSVKPKPVADYWVLDDENTSAEEVSFYSFREAKQAASDHGCGLVAYHRTLTRIDAAQPKQQEPLFKKLIDGVPGLAEELKALDAAQPEQEPVAWMYADDYERMLNSETFCTVYSVAVGSPTRGETTVELFTTPPAREWVGLMDDERNAIEAVTLGLHGIPSFFATAIEAKLKELNHG